MFGQDSFNFEKNDEIIERDLKMEIDKREDQRHFLYPTPYQEPELKERFLNKEFESMIAGKSQHLKQHKLYPAYESNMLFYHFVLKSGVQVPKSFQNIIRYMMRQGRFKVYRNIQTIHNFYSSLNFQTQREREDGIVILSAIVNSINRVLRSKYQRLLLLEDTSPLPSAIKHYAEKQLRFLERRQLAFYAHLNSVDRRIWIRQYPPQANRLTRNRRNSNNNRNNNRNSNSNRNNNRNRNSNVNRNRNRRRI